MEETLYTIRNGKVTLHVNPDYSGKQFEFVGLTVEGDESFYMESADEFYQKRYDVSDRRCVGLGSYLKGVYKALADAELAAHLEEHIHDRDFYICDRRDTPQVWYSAGQSPEYRRYSKLVLVSVIDGIVGYELDQTVCLYDFVNKKPLGFQSAHNGKTVRTTPMRVFYGLYLDQLMALEQHKRGTAPSAYSELVRLAAFLDGKKSVKLVMKDGGVHELKPHNGCDVSISRLLSIVPTDESYPFTLHDDYDLKPRFERGRHLTDLDCLRYGRHSFMLDAAALRSAT